MKINVREGKSSIKEKPVELNVFHALRKMRKKNFELKTLRGNIQ